MTIVQAAERGYRRLTRPGWSGGYVKLHVAGPDRRGVGGHGPRARVYEAGRPAEEVYLLFYAPARAADWEPHEGGRHEHDVEGRW
jgi:hypothetical protein